MATSRSNERIPTIRLGGRLYSREYVVQSLRQSAEYIGIWIGKSWGKKPGWWEDSVMPDPAIFNWLNTEEIFSPNCVFFLKKQEAACESLLLLFMAEAVEAGDLP